MQKPTLIAAGAVVLAGLAAAPAVVATAATPSRSAGLGPDVNIRVEGLNRTLLGQVSLHLPTGTLKTDGHAYSGETAAGALQSATRGRWGGSWSSSYKEFLVTKILGETDSYAKTKSYWEFFVNDKLATEGINDEKLTAGDTVLFAAVPNSASSGDTPLGLSWTISGTKLTAKVVSYSAKGTASPLAGATVKLDGVNATTAANGTASFTSPARTATLTASAKGHIRDEILVPLTGPTAK